jgi:DNA-binding CsgD family transcriptional regulator
VLDLARGDLLAARAALDRAAAGWRERRRFWEGTWARLDQARCALAARRVAAGNTNRQIAAELLLSPKTVGSHVEHILTKLGAARRAEIAAWVAALPPGPGPAAG